MQLSNIAPRYKPDFAKPVILYVGLAVNSTRLRRRRFLARYLCLGSYGSRLASVLDALRSWEPPPLFAVDGVGQPMPDNVADVFRTRQIASPLLSLVVGGAVLNCNFFQSDKIEFDLDPSDITGPEQAAALAVFVRLLGEVTGRVVVLTEENQKHAVIARYMPFSQDVVWIPRPARFY